MPDCKALLRRFLTAYDASDARKIIFLEKLTPFLEHFHDMDVAISDRDAVNEFFASLRRRYSPATYYTYIGVVRRFLSWVNNGVSAESMRDLHSKRDAKIRRKLRPDDMWTWEDGAKVATASCSIQFAAIVQVELDCGFRPSEFIDLTYGDVEISSQMAIFHVTGGKTGERSVVAKRCVPAILKWLNCHPTKKPSDPLWVQERSIASATNGNISITRYRYPAIRKRLKVIAKRVGIRKPTDFYNLRHSSCVLDKMDNLPTDLAAERHGHSVKFYTCTYGRLSIKDVVKRFESHYALEPSEEPAETFQHLQCAECDFTNSHDARWCSRCAAPLKQSDAPQHQKRLTPILHTDTTANVETENGSPIADPQDTFRSEQARLLKQILDVKRSLEIERKKMVNLLQP